MRKTLWKCRNGVGRPELAPRPPSPVRREISPEMRDKCFKCLEKGHFRRDCMNKVVCIRYGLPGHEAKDCKRPRSPSSSEELRRAAVAKVVRRTDQAAGGCGAGPSRQAVPRQAPPPPPPPPSTTMVPPIWPRLEVASDLEMSPEELCVVRRSRSMDELERRFQHAMVVFVGGNRSEVSPEFVLSALKERLEISADRVSVHRFRPKDFIVVFVRPEDQNRVGARPVLEFQGERLSFRQWIRQSQAVFAAMRIKVTW